jgi:hypothetical protein
MPKASDTAPISGGKTAPPTMAIMSKDDPAFVYEPSLCMAVGKITGHIIELHKPIPTIAYKPIMPNEI